MKALLQKATAWMHGCGHPEVSEGCPCKCRLVKPLLFLGMFNIFMRLVAYKLNLPHP